MLDVPGPEQAGSSSPSCTTGFWLTPFCTNFGMALKELLSPFSPEGLYRQTLPFIHSSDFSLVERCQRKQQRSPGFSHPDNPHCWGEKPDVLQIGLSCGRKQSPGMLKKPLPGAIAPGTFHVVTPLRESPKSCCCPSWGDIRTNRGNMPSPVVAGTLMCRIKRNYIFSQSGLGLLLNIFFFKAKFFNRRWGHNFDQMPVLHN